ncbi:hypothetical protein [Actinoalloteichus spitiensis]|uniref:hypothetical protein n=1 Tax=Actinoalloteichus spitiensis TaxID=252394 RepID=UPI00037B39A4|nr:hypothetical protein [Actinoalloteichus spitiensis]
MDAWTELALIDASTSRHHRSTNGTTSAGTRQDPPAPTPRTARSRQGRSTSGWAWWPARRLAH